MPIRPLTSAVLDWSKKQPALFDTLLPSVPILTATAALIPVCFSPFLAMKPVMVGVSLPPIGLLTKAEQPLGAYPIYQGLVAVSPKAVSPLLFAYGGVLIAFAPVTAFW